MKSEMIFSGFGGQGALAIGKFIAQSAMSEGKNVSWLPSYGPEMRGGTANVSVVVSDTEIASPVVSFPHIMVALNQPSLDKFGPSVKANGLIVVNEDLCPNVVKRDGVDYVVAPLNKISKEIGDDKVLNMIAIGIIIEKTNIIKYDTLADHLTSFLKDRNAELLALNLEAIKKGMELAR
ncbi:MAG TPA: 2-oxoacid:acceptor oxidoreductase family protein [Candidatus Cloacimonadota bacterium]|nr:2-oxoacid:acceptor oxidoreductase family protein [Candidatus Cloacimonadota bacterium]HPK41091.1 2-oxoacid:acceptor oxidoreductase family protein [Candidatus Cloacimonadota bacterium]